MTTLYLIRHAEAEGNLFKRIHGQYDSPVTPLGRGQIECLRKRFDRIHVDAVYASDLKRTCQTAEAVYLPKGLKLQKEPRLREIHLGVWEDRPFGEVMRRDMDKIVAFSSGDPAWSAEGGESLGEVCDRVCAALRDIIAANPDRTVAVFSHGTAIRQVLTRLSGSGVYLKEGMNTAVSCLEADEQGIRVLWYNDASHLSPEIAAAAARPDVDDEAQIRREGPQEMLWFRPWDAKLEQEAYLAWRKEGWLSSHGTMERYDGDAFLKAALSHSAFDVSAVQVVMCGETPAGILELDYEKGREEGVGAIAFYYVDTAHRKRGLGVQLLGMAISAYRPMGRTKLRLRCAPENQTAYRFYTRQGFKQICMAEDSVVPLYLMERPI